MKALTVIFTLLISISLLGWGGGKKFKNLSKEEIFQKMSEKKYSILKEKVELTKAEEEIVLPILKSYDQKRFELMSKNFEKGKELRDAENKNYDEILQHQKEMIDAMQKGLELEKAKIAELEKAGVNTETIVKLERFERRFMMHHKGKMRGLKDGKGPHFDDDSQNEE
ncbi:hypothetical protein JXR93_09165 [bacterium]|nr:hypothetical protein [bacterium]